jgi:hypothetical protein
MFLIEDAILANNSLFRSQADADAATEAEACLSDAGCENAECDACESRYTSVELFTPNCDDCVWAWNDEDGYWFAYAMCAECGREEYILASAGL